MLLLYIFSALLLALLFPTSEDVSTHASALPTAFPDPEIPEGFLVYDESGGEITELSTEEFVIANLALEMSPDSPKEALKAQAIASRSYFSRLKEENIHREFHFVCSSEKGIVYAPEEYFKKLWGDDFDSNMEKIRSAVRETEGLVLTYAGAIACAAYFPVSSGATIADPDFSYLISVASPYDSLSSYFEDEKRFSPEEVIDICSKTWPEGKFDFELEYKNWFTDIVYSTGSAVYSVNICGFGVTGNEVRNAFSLASQAFMVEFTEGEFIFHTRGLGHGVGMSQQGALQMAGMGASCEEILSWYYPGTVLVGG